MEDVPYSPKDESVRKMRVQTSKSLKGRDGNRIKLHIRPVALVELLNALCDLLMRLPPFPDLQGQTNNTPLLGRYTTVEKGNNYT